MDKPKNILYENNFLEIEMLNPNYPFLNMKKPGVVVVPYDSSGNIYFIYRNRLNIGEYYELPRGFVENEESYMAGAIRELLEETGMKPITSKDLGELQPDTGICKNKIKVISLLLKKTENHIHYDVCDNSENKVIALAKKDIINLTSLNKIICSLTLSALMKYFADSLENVAK